jgi:hypothetical protein
LPNFFLERLVIVPKNASNLRTLSAKFVADLEEHGARISARAHVAAEEYPAVRH